PYLGVLGEEPQREPLLLLSDADGIAAAPDIASRQSVTQPIASDAQDLHVRRLQAELLEELAIQRLLGALAGIDAALRELPRVLADALGPKHLPCPSGQDDAHVGPVAFGVDHARILELRLRRFFHTPIARANAAILRAPQRPTPSSRVMRLAVFDLDHTLLAGDSDY